MFIKWTFAKENSKMKVKIKVALVAVLLTAFVVVFAGEAMAEKDPKWVTWSATGRIIRNPDKNIPITAGNYYVVEIQITYTNNSKDTDIIAFYDKYVKLTATTNQWFGNLPSGKPTWASVTSDKINKVEVWPGKSYSLVYYMDISNFTKPGATGWSGFNREIGNTKNAYSAYLKNRSVTHNFNVRTKRAN